MDTGRFRTAVAVLAFCGCIVIAAVVDPSLVGLVQTVLPVGLLAAGWLFGSGFTEKLKRGRDDEQP